MSTPEGIVKKEIIEYLKLRGVYHWTHQAGKVPGRRLIKTGIADIIGCYNGRLLAIEVKAAKGKLTPEQKRFLDDVNQAGGIAFVARCVADVVDKMTDT